MDYLDRKYFMLLSNRLDRFLIKKQSPFLANFRCPICLDSKKSKTKARGYVYERKGALNFICHNCGASMSAIKLVKQLDPVLYDEYTLERYRGGTDRDEYPMIKMDAPVFKTQGDTLKRALDSKKLMRLKDLRSTHSAWNLVNQRLIDPEIAKDWFHTEEFYSLCNDFRPGKFARDLVKKHEHSRLMIPFYYGNSLIAFQGRAYSDFGAARYITLTVDENFPHIYNLDNVFWESDVYVFEGPIDASFIDNSIAIAGGEAVSSLARLRTLAPEAQDASFVIVYDNEPRSLHTVKKMKRCIEAKHRVCFWPERIAEKDVNDMVLSGMRPSEIRYIIHSNSYSDIRAELELSRWRKT